MQKPLLLFAFCAGVLQVNAQTTCATAVAVTLPGTYAVSAIGPSEVPFPICANNGVQDVTGSRWFTFTPDVDTTVVISTAASGVDTRFHVYTGACGSLMCVSGDDDSGPNLTSVATFDVVGGTLYTIAFDDRWSSNGFNFSLTEVTPVIPPEGLVTFTGTPTGAGPNPMCVVDMTNDGLDDIVAVDYTMIYITRQLAGGGFTTSTYPTTSADFLASWSICAGDLDGNGHNDLLYGAGTGVTFMFASDDGTAYTEVSGPEYVFSQRSNMVDINNDGNLDAFVCHDVAPNVYYLNDGDGNLVFHQGGLGPNGGNYGSLWTDFDNDGDMDMFISKCGSSPPDVFMQNNGDGTFTDIAAPLGFADNHQSWSSAWGDYDNDADMDVLVGSSSSGIHKLMRNNGDGTFTNITAGSGVDNFTGQSIEWTTHDFNNDGWLDILGGGGLLVNNGDWTFTENAETPYNGPIGDLNNDGFMDILSANTAYLNDGNDNNWITVNTVGTSSNANGIGARITITSALGTQIREVRSGDGFRYMSTLMAHFGLGQDTEVEEVTIQWPSGMVDIIPSPEINTTVTVTEGFSTAVAATPAQPQLNIFPNPATDVVGFTGIPVGNSSSAVVRDVTGKVVLKSTLRNGRLDVSALTAGVYVVEVSAHGKVLNSTFVKQ